MSRSRGDIRDAAIGWAVAYEAGLDGAEASELRAWLDADPRNAVEWELARDLMRGPELDMALAEVMAGEARPDPRASRTGMPAVWRRWMRPVLASAGAAVLASLLVLAGPWSAPTRDAAPAHIAAAVWEGRYHTGRGETSTIALPDGSQITLNADTRLRVALQPDRRDITLLRGEAVFDVAPDAERPFSVRAGDVAFTALGTVFNVDRRSNTVELSVFEGRVELDDGQTVLTDRPVFTRDTRVTLARDGARMVTTLSGRAVPDWTEGWLETAGMSLSLLVEELQRYSDRPIVLAPGLGELAVTGRFRTGEVARTLSSVALLHDLQVEDTASAIRVVRQD